MLSWIRQTAPGITLAFVLAMAAKLSTEALGRWATDGGAIPVSPVLCAVLIGILWRNVWGISPRCDDGLRWVTHTLLRAGIVLIGLRLTLIGTTEIAATAIPVVVACISTALFVGFGIVRALGVSSRLGFLLSVGAAVCGCTAVMTVAPIIRSRHYETGFAIACVVLFGCLGMLLDPWIARQLFEDSAVHAGIFLGTAIHDTSQVIGAGLIYSEQYSTPDTLTAASVTKLLRNLSIAVFVPAAAWFMRRHSGADGAPHTDSKALPGFVVLFILLIFARTAGDAFVGASNIAAELWGDVISSGQRVSELLLICAMTAVGLNVSIAQLRSVGWRPLAAGAVVATAVALCSAVVTFVIAP